MDMAMRAQLYNDSQWGQRYPASQLRVVVEQGAPVVYGTWLIGNDYRNKSRLYGSYPPGYLDRMAVLFPDKRRVLHAFAGSLPPGDYTRLDLIRDEQRDPDVQGDVCDAPMLLDDTYDVAYADPPYSKADATHYGTGMVNRRLATLALGLVLTQDGHLVWMDTCWPQHRKAQLRTAGRITVIRSTNHRVRLVTIFERMAA